ncbi:hypothetical protein FJZ53_04490 [Candidatus Woesearchaeota archaeon]|nr:hypothetical protein [Candidatus Woesearchaeota archaeon]
MDKTEGYKAANISVFKTLDSVRENYNLFELAQQINKTGDKKNLAKKLNINRSVLSRAIDEAGILSTFKLINKSKVVPLARLKTIKERKLFFEKYDINKLECRRLYRLVKGWRTLLEKDPRVLLTKEQHDLILGSTLGDASIRQRNKNCSFRVGHTKQQEKYLNWKYRLVKEFTKLPPSWNIRKLNNHTIKTLEFSTFTHHVFNFYRKLFYKDGRKRVTREILNMLTPRSLAIWVCDDGSFGTSQPYIILCTNAFSLQEHETIKKYFEEIWGLSPTIGFRDKKYYYLRFKEKDTQKLIGIIKPFVHESMKHKIGEKNE